MRIYLVRHAAAIERAETTPDATRYLTAKGRIEFREIARRARNAGAAPNLIFTSPLLRAVQTAEILSERLKHRGEILVVRELSPGFDLRSLRALLARRADLAEAAFVGHEPDLGVVCSALLSLTAGFPLRKGAVVALEVAKSAPKGGAKFLWRVDGKGTVDRLEDAASG